MATEQSNAPRSPKSLTSTRIRPRTWPGPTTRNRPTSTLPGSGGTVSGTAVTDWVDDEDKGKIETSAQEGKVEFRKTEEFRKKQAEVRLRATIVTH